MILIWNKYFKLVLNKNDRTINCRFQYSFSFACCMINGRAGKNLTRF